MIFTSAREYIESCSSLQAKITAIDSIITALILTSTTASETDNINEYWLNDGQTQIKTIYRGVNQIQSSIQAFERLRQMYINRLTGRVSVLMDSKTFNGNGGR